ncbi:hypothetical protein, partial [Photobacterium chitinilyticum]|uniref:hypothetical protein n=1 Tax=Photobacterium chitinilyticum TaxID=2485123 RepID=UPI001F2A5274
MEFGALCWFSVGHLIAGVMHLRAKFIDGRMFIVHFHDFSGYSFSERLPESSENSRLSFSLSPFTL